MKSKMQRTTRVQKWHFNDEVAARFDAEARTHIPNYEQVIQKCVQIACAAFPEKDARIIDVGSATGYTLERLLAAGFSDVHGVESSFAMIEKCRSRERVIHSHSFPASHGPFDMVLANWTLHFIRKREAYIRAVVDSLTPRGIFIVSDKMQSSPIVHARYHDFKRSLGVSSEEITRKHLALHDVLVPFSLHWYLELFEKLDLKYISVIDGTWCFTTLIAFKQPQNVTL